MTISANRITPCLWFDTRAEEAATFYVSVFSDSRIRKISRYPEGGEEIHGKQAGSVMTVEFEIEGQRFVALNGGPQFTFDEAISFQVHCETQGEVDHFWDALGEGGEESQCGWLRDKFGLSWQVIPNALPEMLSDKDPEKRDRVMNAMLQMKKLDIPALKRAYEGKAA